MYGGGGESDIFNAPFQNYAAKQTRTIDVKRSFSDSQLRASVVTVAKFARRTNTAQRSDRAVYDNRRSSSSVVGWSNTPVCFENDRFAFSETTRALQNTHSSTVESIILRTFENARPAFNRDRFRLEKLLL